MADGRLTRWFEEQIRELRRQAPERPGAGTGARNPTGDEAADLLELEALRDEARRLEEGATHHDE